MRRLRVSHVLHAVLLCLAFGCAGEDDGQGTPPGALPSGPVGAFDASVAAGPGGTGDPAIGSDAGNQEGGTAPMAGGSDATTGGAGAVDAGPVRVDGALAGGACNGLTMCGVACVNTMSDPSHCGACGRACNGQCQAGGCVPAVAGTDGCSDLPVAGLSLSEIAVYQSVKIPLMMNQTAVARAQRKADIVQGRDAVFRVHVAPGAGFTPRQVSARLALSSGAAGAPADTTLFFAKLTPSGPSSDDKPESAFLIKVPAAALAANTHYAVSLVECAPGAAPGMAQGARYPADGFAPLEARATGALRVHLVPMNTGGTVPDITPAAVTLYQERIMAIYPVTKVEFTVGAPLASSGTSMCNHLTAIRSRRSADNAPVDLYYFGLTQGLSGGQSGCSNALASANSSAKTAVGWQTTTDPDRGARGAATMAHELGHSHGRLHAPCGVQDPDPSYPYPTANIGVWGHDMRSDAFLPPTRKDMMSYCPNPDRTLAWVSDYTYQALLQRVAAVNALVGQGMYVKGAVQRAWRQLVVDSTGRHWAEYPLMVQGAPEGTALSAIVRHRDGATSTITVYKEELDDGVSQHPYLLTVPEAKPEWRTIEVPGLLAAQVF